MHRRRTPRPAAQAQALVVLAALPLVLTTSAVGVTHASATHTGESGPAPTTASLEAITADELTEQPDTGGLEAVPAAFQVPERRALGKPRAGDIPWGALQAYQRAADILGEVQPSCGLSWTLLGAVGQVESEHGTARGSELGDDGVVTPALLSRALDGKGERPAVEDTDGGEVDGDDTWDRAVGPMQLLPGVWSLVGVDGDGDGTRSPQDVDDAALAAAVYLCAVGTDLADPEGAAEALAEYNGSKGYAEQVLAVEKRYAERDFAVSGAPDPSTIGPSLGQGQGTPAQESERALREAQEQREQVETVLTARYRADTAPTAPTAEPKPAPTTKPSPTAAPKVDEKVVAAAPEPRSTRPGVTEKPAGASTEGPVESSADEPADVPTEPTGSAAPLDEVEPGHLPADDPTRQPTDERTEEPTGRPTDEPAEEPTEQPTDATEEPTEEPTEQPTDATEEPAEEPTEEPAEGDSGEVDETDPADEAEPTTRTLEGLLTVCGEDLCLDGTVLDLTPAGDLTADAGEDLDGNDVIETVGEELAGLEGQNVELLVIEGSEPLLVVAVNGHVIVPE